MIYHLTLLNVYVGMCGRDMQAMDASAIQRLGLLAHDAIIGAQNQSEQSRQGLNGATVEALRSLAFEDSLMAESDSSVSARHVPRIRSRTQMQSSRWFTATSLSASS